MDYNPKVSVIVPVYNVETYVRTCIESIINQSYQNLEILLINDGSTDKSKFICEEYELCDNRIKIINQSNQGPSQSRNKGIEISTGKYIIFIDSDDYWDDLYCIEKMINNITESDADVLNFGYKKFFEGKKIVGSCKFDKRFVNIDCKKSTMTYLAKNNLIISGAWNKIIKRQLIIDNNLTFIPGITSEDIDWTARLFIVAKRIDVMNDSFYVYRQRKGSITSSISEKNLQQLLKNIEQCIKYIEIYKLEESNLMEEYMTYVAYQYMVLLVAIQISKTKIDKDTLFKIKEYKKLLKYNLNYRVRIFNKINKYFGFFILNKIIKIYVLKGAI